MRGMAFTRWMMPFWRVMRPTKRTKGLDRSMPWRSSASSVSLRRYSSGSMPLWMTWTLSGRTSNRRSTSSRVSRETAMTASARSIAVRSIQALRW